MPHLTLEHMSSALFCAAQSLLVAACKGDLPMFVGMISENILKSFTFVR